MEPVKNPFHSFETDKVRHFLLTWTPRAIVVGFGAYYGLGIAYATGLMAAIDKIAIVILKNSVGYAGIGALMPTVQWYTNLGARIAIGAGAAVTYDLTFKTIHFTYTKILSPSLRQPIPMTSVHEKVGSLRV